jgi:hypothetical protein
MVRNTGVNPHFFAHFLGSGNGYTKSIEHTRLRSTQENSAVSTGSCLF